VVVGIEEEIGRLYSLPLDEFTAARDKAAKELRASGDKDGAARIKALKKPNIAAWALNQLAHRGELDELFDVTDRLRDVQRKVMSGAKADLRGATDERNAAVAKLTKLAGTVLDEGGHAGAPQTLSQVSDALLAVASDEEGAEVLRAGRLVRELKPGRVVDMGVLGVVESEPDEEEAPPSPDKRAALETAIALAEHAMREADAAEAEARRLADEAEQAERRAKSAAEAAEFARRGAEARRTEADEARRAVELLRRE
jgi:hypothetical protein